jgi:hypothetical protein
MGRAAAGAGADTGAGAATGTGADTGAGAGADTDTGAGAGAGAEAGAGAPEQPGRVVARRTAESDHLRLMGAGVARRHREGQEIGPPRRPEPPAVT